MAIESRNLCTQIGYESFYAMTRQTHQTRQAR